jgi:integrase
MKMKTRSDRGLFRRPGSPHWWVRYADKSGRIRRESTGTSEKKLAREILAKKKVLVAENRHLEVKKVPRTTFFQLCDLYWEKRGKSRKTKGLSSTIKSWKDYFGNVRSADMTQSRIEDFLADRVDKQRLSQSTRNRYIAELKRLFNWGMEYRSDGMNKPPLVEHNPAVALKRSKEKKYQRKRFLSQEELSRFLEACRDDFRPFVVTALHGGLRRGELFNLRWEDIDFTNRLIVVRDSKSGDPREIPMDETLAGALRGLPSRFKRGYVFPSPKTGGRLTDVKKQFRTVLRKANIQNFRLHDARHTFASYLVMNGVDLKTVSELLGHADTRMTERYSHLSPKHKARAVKILDSALQTDTKTDTVENSKSGGSL